jgi:asparagine synthase (glutamine-hydrolysing)
MCGIAGIVSVDPLTRDDCARAVAMRDVMTYRGPDGAGLHADAHAVLAHRRLSIIDLAGGHQPLSNETGSVWITYNGEIYNHADVRAQLEARGTDIERTRIRKRSFTPTSNGATHACTGSAACSRSRSGMLRRAGCCSFETVSASSLCTGHSPARSCSLRRRLKGFSRVGLVAVSPNHRVLSEVLATRGTSGEETMFEGVYKLLPGHRLVFEDGRVHTRSIGNYRSTAPTPTSNG